MFLISRIFLVFFVGVFFLSSPLAPSYVLALNQPNLSAFNIAVDGILFAGRDLTFSGIVKNIGGVSAGVPTFVRVSLDSSKLEDLATSALAPGEIFTVSSRWTATAGTHRLRLCADVTHLEEESNEDDNCSGDHIFTVSAGAGLGTPQATIIFPNGGETWRVGETHRIDWTIYNYSNALNLTLVDGFNNRHILDIVKSLPALTRGFDWYIADVEPANDYKLAVTDAQGNILDASNNFFTIGGASAPSLVRAEGDDKVYRVINGKRLWVPTLQALDAQGFSFLEVQERAANEVNAIPRLRLMRARGDTKVYFITSGGLKRWVRTIDVFNSYNNKWEDVIEVDPAVVSSLNDSDLLRADGDTKIYKIENNKKRWIKNAQVFERESYNWSLVASANSAELNSYEAGTAIE